MFDIQTGRIKTMLSNTDQLRCLYVGVGVWVGCKSIRKKVSTNNTIQGVPGSL